MITWLFTQVWLWSLAAFALGALITWMLFVRPLQRRLVAVTTAYPDDEYYDYDERYDRRESSLDLLQPAPHAEPEPEVGDWGRVPRPWVTPERAEDADSDWFREWDRRVNAIGADADDTAVSAVQPRGAAQDAGSVELSEPAPAGESAGAVASVGEEQPTAFNRALWPEPESGGAESGEAESGDAGDKAAKAGDATESQVPAEPLRSLFETTESPKKASETPYVPPVGADATQVIPSVGGAGAAEPLPRRTPGAGPRPGREGGGSGPMIKGHSASRQYHSPESPAYDKITADVWFRTAGDAEIAGFEPWNGKRAT